MARFRLVAKDVATGTAAKTLAQILAPSGQRLRVVSWKISFNGVTAANVPGSVDLLRQTSAGTSTAATPVKLDEASPDTAPTAGVNFTAEPGSGDILDSVKVTPNGGTHPEFYEPEDRAVIAASGRVGLRATYANDVTVNVVLTVETF